MVGAIFSTDLTEIATQIAEAAAGIGSILAGFKNVELARKYYDLYQHQREFYYTVFQAGVEVPLINEIYNTPYYNRDYAARVGTLYNADTGPFGGRSGDILGWWTRHSNMYGEQPDAQISELEVDTARIRSDWSNYLFRFEELWADVRNDKRWADRLMLHNVGLKQGTSVVSNLTSSLKEYQANISDLGNQLATYGNGIAMYAGYKRGLSDTADDFSRGTTFAQDGSPRVMSAPGMIGHKDYYDRVTTGVSA
jgi:hypothetical protein